MLEYRAHAATGGSEGHNDIYRVAALGKGRDPAKIDQPQIDNVHWNLRVENGFHHFPSVLFHGFGFLAGFQVAQERRFLSQGIGIFPIDAYHMTVLGGDGIIAAQGLK